MAKKTSRSIASPLTSARHRVDITGQEVFGAVAMGLHLGLASQGGMDRWSGQGTQWLLEIGKKEDT